MKKLLLFVPIILLLWSTVSYGAVINFAWDPNSDVVSGYRLYQTTVSGQYTFGSGNEVLQISVGTETGSVDVPDGTYFWVLTAFDASGNESVPSNEVSKIVDTTISAPQNLRIL